MRRKNFKVQIIMNDEQTYFCDVGKPSDVDDILNSFKESKIARDIIVYGKNDDGYVILHRENKIGIGFR